MTDFTKVLGDIAASLSQLAEAEKALIAKTGTADPAALDKIVSDCVQLDAARDGQGNAIQAARDQAQILYPKAIAAKQLKGIFAVNDMIGSDLGRIAALVVVHV